MSNKSYQISPNVHIITDPKSDTAMVYHALYGNTRLINSEGTFFKSI